ncbi:hypothetical protein BDV93DRAFT_262611 [Ceratobasidium sp. AG-I]|nr:hypothetical protein BDV93DRAFT_262611 [Ceratobasidium sp. AG-I]
MEEDQARAARAKARQQHLNLEDLVPCPCDRCHGANQQPKTMRMHMKAQATRQQAIGFPQCAAPAEPSTSNLTCAGTSIPLRAPPSPHSAPPSPRSPPDQIPSSPRPRPASPPSPLERK